MFTVRAWSVWLKFLPLEVGPSNHDPEPHLEVVGIADPPAVPLTQEPESVRQSRARAVGVGVCRIKLKQHYAKGQGKSPFLYHFLCAIQIKNASVLVRTTKDSLKQEVPQQTEGLQGLQMLHNLI